MDHQPELDLHAFFFYIFVIRFFVKNKRDVPIVYTKF